MNKVSNFPCFGKNNLIIIYIKCVIYIINMYLKKTLHLYIIKNVTKLEKIYFTKLDLR